MIAGRSFPISHAGSPSGRTLPPRRRQHGPQRLLLSSGTSVRRARPLPLCPASCRSFFGRRGQQGVSSGGYPSAVPRPSGGGDVAGALVSAASEKLLGIYRAGWSLSVSVSCLNGLRVILMQCISTVTGTFGGGDVPGARVDRFSVFLGSSKTGSNFYLDNSWDHCDG